MVDTGPGTQMPHQLVTYWTVGPGAALVRWNSPGDYMRCVTHIQEAVVKDRGAPLPDHVVKGLCSTLHRIATGGFSPGHAPGEQRGKR